MFRNFFVTGVNSIPSSMFKNKVNQLIKQCKKAYLLKPTVEKNTTSISKQKFQYLLNCQLTSRLLDFASFELFSKKQSYYDINNMGHEGMAVVASHIKLSDPKLLHYRSGAAFIEWLERAGDDAITEVLRSLFCSSHSFSGGRHKVYGSMKSNIIPQTSTVASQIPKATGLAAAILKAQEIKANGRFTNDSIVFCTFGDGSFNHGSAQEAFSMIQWYDFQKKPLPVLLVCENNGVSISTQNPKGYIEQVMSDRYGLQYIKTNGLNILDTYEKSKKAAEIVRETKKAVFLDIEVKRLSSHYLSTLDNTAESTHDMEDPILFSIGISSQYGITAEEITDYIHKTATKISQKMLILSQEPQFQREETKQLPSFDQKKNLQLMPPSSLTLAEALNSSLIELMHQYSKIVIMGDDVANSTGGVWGVTKNLAQLFGKERVFNTSIAETSILATAQMMGLNNLMPIVEIRHLAFLHNAIDQIRGEAATSAWLSNNYFPCPFILRIPGLGYSLQGGHFHNDTSIAALRDIPGLIIACPTSADVVMEILQTSFNMAFVQKSIVIIIEPIILYHKSHSFALKLNRILKLKNIALYGSSNFLTIISYGNCFVMAMEIQEELIKRNIHIQVLDLRWLKPLAMESINKAIQSTQHVLIIDEGRKTASISEELYTRIEEEAPGSHQIHRITTKDELIPLGQAALSVFPQKKEIMDFINHNILKLDFSEDTVNTVRNHTI